MMAADVITTITENGFFGKCTSTSAASGLGVVKTARTLLVATFTEPVAAAQAIPQVLKAAEELAHSGS